jgi:hypothetical protein
VGAVFISYRRGDAEGQARALYGELVKLLGKDSVFMDVDSIALGRDFRHVLQERLGSCDVMLALIGPGWLDAKDGTGARRLESPTDFVRQELAAALKRNIPVIPLLVQGTQVPPPDRLPDDLKDLSYRNAFELGHSTWESDIREMTTRLGLGSATSGPAPAPSAMPPASPPASSGSPSPASSASPWYSRRPVAVAGVAALVLGAAALVGLVDWNTSPADSSTAGIVPLATPSTRDKAPSPGGTTVTPLPAAAPAAATSSGGGASLLEFVWPGNDCWDIFRGSDYVTHQCGSNTQALAAGTYTIKGKYAQVFVPFEITVKQGAATRIVKGGVFEFVWPGQDCWDIMRSDAYVTHQCGSNKQALEAGTYTIKGKYAAVITPFNVDVKDGASTRVAKGGVFSFKWPGNDCWDILRGADYVTHQCGTNKQALDAGTYTIKGKYAAVFPPFDITIVNGGEVVKTP